MIKTKDVKLFNIYMLYSNTISINETFIPIEKIKDGFIGILDQEYFDEDMNGIYINVFKPSKHITYEEFETEFPEKYIKFIFEE